MISGIIFSVLFSLSLHLSETELCSTISIFIWLLSKGKKPNWGQWNTKQRESHWLKHLKAGNKKRKIERLWLHFTCQRHAEEHVCARVQARVSLCMFMVYALNVCARVCYAWRHTCTNRVVVGSDSCPVPFTAQSSQPPLCSIRLLMRINVLWRPVGLPHLHPPPTAQLMKKYNLAKILR